jgi:hypothetical protein
MSSVLDDFLLKIEAMPRNPIGNKQAREALKQARSLLKRLDQKLALLQRKLSARGKGTSRRVARRR